MVYGAVCAEPKVGKGRTIGSSVLRVAEIGLPAIAIVIVAVIVVPLFRGVYEFIILLLLVLGALVASLCAVLVKEAGRLLAHVATVLGVSYVLRLFLVYFYLSYVIVLSVNPQGFIRPLGRMVLEARGTHTTLALIALFIAAFVFLIVGVARILKGIEDYTLDVIQERDKATYSDLTSGLISEDEARKRRHETGDEEQRLEAVGDATTYLRLEAVLLMFTVFFLMLIALIADTTMPPSPFPDFLPTPVLATEYLAGFSLVYMLHLLTLTVAVRLLVGRATASE